MGPTIMISQQNSFQYLSEIVLPCNLRFINSRTYLTVKLYFLQGYRKGCKTCLCMLREAFETSDRIKKWHGHVIILFLLPPCQNKSLCKNIHSHENVFHLHANQTRLHKSGFEHGLILKQRHKVNWKYPIGLHMKLKMRTSR